MCSGLSTYLPWQWKIKVKVPFSHHDHYGASSYFFLMIAVDEWWGQSHAGHLEFLRKFCVWTNQTHNRMHDWLPGISPSLTWEFVLSEDNASTTKLLVIIAITPLRSKTILSQIYSCFEDNAYASIKSRKI